MRSTGWLYGRVGLLEMLLLMALAGVGILLAQERGQQASGETEQNWEAAGSQQEPPPDTWHIFSQQVVSRYPEVQRVATWLPGLLIEDSGQTKAVVGRLAELPRLQRVHYYGTLEEIRSARRIIAGSLRLTVGQFVAHAVGNWDFSRLLQELLKGFPRKPGSPEMDWTWLAKAFKSEEDPALSAWVESPPVLHASEGGEPSEPPEGVGSAEDGYGTHLDGKNPLADSRHQIQRLSRVLQSTEAELAQTRETERQLGEHLKNLEQTQTAPLSKTQPGLEPIGNPLQQEFARLEREVMKKIEEARRLKIAMGQAASRLKELSEERSRLETQLSQAQKKIADLQSQLQAKEQQLQAQISSLTTFQKQVEEMGGGLAGKHRGKSLELHEHAEEQGDAGD